MLFRLCNAPATFPRLMQNCLRELNLTYCLIYLDDVIVFLKTEEEHLKCLCVVFDHFWEHHLRLKPTKCEFFWGEINYLTHHVSKEGMQTSKENLKAVAEFSPPQTYMEIWSFLGLMGHYRWFIKGFHVLHNPDMSIYLEKVPIRRGSGWHSQWRPRMPLRLLRRLVSRLLCWLLLTSISHSSWKPMTPASLGLGAVLSQKQTDGHYHLVAYANWSVT